MTLPTALVLGAGGQLGRACIDLAPSNIVVTGLARAECDLTDTEAMRGYLDRVDPRCIINAAAYTAVDQAEAEPALAHAINAQAPGELAALCAQRGIRLVHVSTDFVFDGSNQMPYQPLDAASPLGVYGESKWRGERAVATSGASHAIVRASWIYSAQGRNFLLTMLRLLNEREEVGVVADQVGAPTSARGLAEICWRLAQHPGGNGVFHWSDSGAISWYEFACAICEEGVELALVPDGVRVKAISTSDYPTPAQRPAYSVLDSAATCTLLGVEQRPWRDALRDVLRSLREHNERAQP